MVRHAALRGGGGDVFGSMHDWLLIDLCITCFQVTKAISTMNSRPSIAYYKPFATALSQCNLWCVHVSDLCTAGPKCPGDHVGGGWD